MYATISSTDGKASPTDVIHRPCDGLIKKQKKIETHILEKKNDRTIESAETVFIPLLSCSRCTRGTKNVASILTRERRLTHTKYGCELTKIFINSCERARFLLCLILSAHANERPRNPQHKKGLNKQTEKRKKRKKNRRSKTCSFPRFFLLSHRARCRSKAPTLPAPLLRRRPAASTTNHEAPPLPTFTPEKGCNDHDGAAGVGELTGCNLSNRGALLPLQINLHTVRIRLQHTLNSSC